VRASWTVLVTASLPGDAVRRLTDAGHRVVGGEEPLGLGHDRIVEALGRDPDTAAIVCLLTERIDAAVLDAAPALRLVANCAVGTDNLDLELLRSRGVTAANTPGVLTEATADLAFALMLDACRNVTAGDRIVRADAWHGWSPTFLLGTRVAGATLGLVGFGRIGQAVARRARGFGMRVLYHQRRRVAPEVEDELAATHVSLEVLLAAADVVSVHCPLTPETRRLLDRERIGSMKKGAVLVNTARGACVDEAALAEALRSGQLSAAGLDVYDGEPRVREELLALPNVVLAPHLGSADRPTRERMAAMCAEAVLEMAAGRVPSNRVQ
jgi:glyoxylate reductase